MEDLPGVTEQLIEDHEEAGEAAAIAFAVLGLASLGALALYRREAEVPRRVALATLVLGLIVGALMVRAANLGGQIRHTEIRGSNGSAGSEGEPHR